MLLKSYWLQLLQHTNFQHTLKIIKDFLFFLKTFQRGYPLSGRITGINFQLLVNNS